MHVLEQTVYAVRRVELKKAWAVHLAEQQQKQQDGSDAEEEKDAADAVNPAEVIPTVTSFHTLSV